MFKAGTVSDESKLRSHKTLLKKHVAEATQRNNNKPVKSERKKEQATTFFASNGSFRCGEGGVRIRKSIGGWPEDYEPSFLPCEEGWQKPTPQLQVSENLGLRETGGGRGKP